jgi:hypothetical protein
MRKLYIAVVVAALGSLAFGSGTHLMVNGQEAFCTHPSHGGGGWSSICYTADNQASQAAGARDLHAKMTGHTGYVTTRPCSR